MQLPRPIPDPLVKMLAAWLEVIGQPVRIRIIEYLDREGETSVSTLAGAVGETAYNTSQHLAALRHAGVVRRRRSGRTCFTRSPTARR